MAPKFLKVQPSLPVSSIPDAIDYYTGCLGFRLAGRDRDDHCWVQLVDDESVSKLDAAVNIYLRRKSSPKFTLEHICRLVGHNETCP